MKAMVEAKLEDEWGAVNGQKDRFFRVKVLER